MADSTTVYIGLGSNIGESAKLIKTALDEFGKCEGIAVSAVSEMLKTKPLGPVDQADYLNAAAKLQTTLSPDELLKSLQAIETSLGREHEVKWGPRTIDLDLLLYGDEIIDRLELTVPHSQMHLRSFVLDAMCELASNLVHPVLKKSMKELNERLGGGNFFLDEEKPQLISIAGIIGVGKTTLGQGLSKEIGCELIREAYETNPYMDQAYAGKQDIALDWQLYFLVSRLKQLDRESLNSGKLYISDYVFSKEQIYAKRVLTEEQRRQYQEEYVIVEPKIAEPVLVIYLKDRPAACLERIKKRNRAYEQQIKEDELKNFFDDYEELFAKWNNCPVITLSLDKFNCLDENDIQRLANEIRSYVWIS
ncbi:MAG: 2-amino-4-hydroxy-6-hydroxymethyldihydropteridine diphosphokinase [Sedimentisphaerales bacterium]|nr:2-amino-4-hydroxy-6-hydroxymethyldihydropteridine diphosphokinase [Sedimentisphaerales bacterium]